MLRHYRALCTWIGVCNEVFCVHVFFIGKSDEGFGQLETLFLSKSKCVPMFSRVFKYLGWNLIATVTGNKCQERSSSKLSTHH